MKNKEKPTPPKPCEQCEQNIAGWKRALADYDNLLKDLDRLKANLHQSARQNAIQLIIPVLDNFDQAVSFTPEGLDEKAQSWLQGILHIQSQLTEVLADLGALPYGAVGDQFDPHEHDALQEVQDQGQADQEIVKVNLRGWKIGERIIRPAKVVINNLK